jgi:pSer/pThr/pTyr-binding forkhead associated (FHA) protein/S1-C subfamily serine protease
VPYLRLIDPVTHRATELRDPLARLGRSPDCTVPFTGASAGVVSALHAELRARGGEWWITDLGSRNGTYVNGRRIDAPVSLRVGDVIGLGESGPRLSVAAVGEALAQTLAERPGLPGLPGLSDLPAAPSERASAEAPRAYALTFLDSTTGRRYEALGTRIRIGRSAECEVHLAPGARADPVVSRVHAELTVAPSGSLILGDAGSKNGTFVNEERVTGPVPVRLGDRIMLGQGGPELIVEGLGTAPQIPVARPPAARGRDTMLKVISHAIARAKEERRQGKRGSTAFLKAVAAEVGKSSGRKLRWVMVLVIALALLLGGAMYGVYWLLSTQVEQTEQAQRTAEDSARAATARLGRELDAARASAAPAAQVDSLRAQLHSAQARTAELGAALERAQAALTSQLAAGEARRAAAQTVVERLHDELTAAERRAPSAASLDSLRRAVVIAEQQTQNLDAKMRAIRGTDFAAIAQQSQAAVGLITVSFGRDYFNGTGFVITADGYMLTNWHVVADSLHPRPDTIWVIMADQSQAHYADVIATSQERDIAIMKIRGYQGGPFLTAIDWRGTKARQGEPAALIGYPAGSGFARLRGTVVRTSMTAGIISRATEDVIQFDGITIGGSSGSPLFNAFGEVIAIHRAGLQQSPGFALSAPTRHAIPIMPVALRQKLGIE